MSKTNYNTKLATPWGQADLDIVVCRGVHIVCTPSHGGIMISKGFAEKRLTTYAIHYGISYGGYYCFEEDCDWAIPAHELIELRTYYVDNTVGGGTYKIVDDMILQTLSRWRADFLIAKGYTPLENEYMSYKQDQKYDEMRAAKHPDLIISASSTNTPNVVEVITADEKIHFVTQTSYHKHYETKSLNLLSYCERI